LIGVGIALVTRLEGAVVTRDGKIDEGRGGGRRGEGGCCDGLAPLAPGIGESVDGSRRTDAIETLRIGAANLA
jgi:hypothetical protein